MKPLKFRELPLEDQQAIIKAREESERSPPFYQIDPRMSLASRRRHDE